MKKSTKHMQFVRISLLIFALGFFFACSLGTQRYGKLSFSIEVPDYLKTETNEQPSNARFIHPNGDRLEFKLYTERRVIHTQTITLNPQPNNPQPDNLNPQTVSISIDKVPYNVPLSAKITVYGEVATGSDETPPILGQNTIDIGRLRYPTKKLTLGVKPEGGETVEYEDQGRDGIFLSEMEEVSSADTFNIKMFPEKGLYTFRVYDSAYIYLYDSDGKNYPNSFLIDNTVVIDNTVEMPVRVRVFYHPEDKKSTYYAYLGVNQQQSFNGVGVSGEKLKQDILITKKNGSSIEILNDDHGEYLGQVNNEDYIKSLALTIYNPYPFTLNLKNTIENADEEDEKNSKDKFTFDFPDVLLPGESKKFTVNFQDNDNNVNNTYSVKSTISAPGAPEVSEFVLYFTGYTS